MSKLFSPLILVPIALVGAITALILIRAAETALVEEVQQGTKVLYCYIDDYVKIIDPEKVSDYSGGTWYFTDGYSTTCILNNS